MFGERSPKRKKKKPEIEMKKGDNYSSRVMRYPAHKLQDLQGSFK